MSNATLEDIHVTSLQVMRDARGALTVVEFSRHVPFAVARLFYVSGVPVGLSRGGHAHRRCSQYMICQSGRLRVAATDGSRERSLELTAGQAVLIEPGIFASQVYLEVDSVLLVLCDRPYEAEDYIHKMDEFLKYRREMA